MDKKMHDMFIKNSYPYPGYNFCMFLDGVKIGFKSISGLTLTKDKFEPFHEGGDNNNIHIHRDSRTDANRLVLTKGLGFFNPAKFLPKIHVMLLLVYDADMKKPIHAYAFSPGYVENISVSDFNATESSVIIDTIEILYDFAIEIDLTGRTTPVMYAQMMAAEAEEAAYSLDRQNRTVSEIARHNAEVRMNKRKKTAPHDESVTDSIEY